MSLGGRAGEYHCIRVVVGTAPSFIAGMSVVLCSTYTLSVATMVTRLISQHHKVSNVSNSLRQ